MKNVKIKIEGETMGTLTEMVAETEQSRQAMGGAAGAEIAAGWLTPQYLVSLRGQMLSLDGAERFALLQKATGNVVSLQLAGVWAGRLRVEQEKLEFLRQKHRDMLEIARQTAAKLAEADERLDPKRPMTEEELKACVDKVDEIMGLK